MTEKALIDNKKRRLQFACRRGMLELDVILNRYLSDAYDAASPEEQASFEKLLSCQDQDLYRWLTRQEAPPEQAQQQMIKILLAKHE